MRCAGINLMKHFSSLISTLLLATVLFSSNIFAQDKVHYSTFAGHTDNIWGLVFSPDGQMLASGSRDGTVCLWEVSTGHQRKILKGLLPGSEVGFAFSPDGRTLATSAALNIDLWDTTTGQHKNSLIGHTTGLTDLTFSPDGRTLASASWGGIFLWNVATGQIRKRLLEHTHDVLSVAFNPNGTLIASGSRDKTIRLWDANTGKSRKTLTGHTDRVTKVVFSSNGNTLASASDDDTIRLWNVATGKYQETLVGFESHVYSLVFSPNGSMLATGSMDGIRLWNVTTGKFHEMFIKSTSKLGIFTSFAISPDWSTFAIGSAFSPTIRSRNIHLWKLTSPHPPKPTANQVYEKAIRAVMWIVNPGIGEGSGVLIDKKSKLAITNAHVTDKQNIIDVYFPAPDEKGELIKDRNFYLTSSGVLKRLGYYTKGHVIAKNEKTDLAIIKLDGLPETARQIDWKFTSPTTKAGDLVYVLGNPAKQDLWRWTLGEFLNDHGEFLHIQSDVFGGNSGGPVLNK